MTVQRELEKLVAAQAENLVQQVGVVRPPVTIQALERIAEIQGVHRVVQKSCLSADGALIPTHDGYLMMLKTQQHEKRFRFTYAHEIAHTLFSPSELSWRRAKHTSRHVAENDIDDNVVEHLCDVGAVHLLMPDFMFGRYVSRLTSLMAALLPLSNIYQASVPAVAQRVVETKREPLVLISWSCDKNDPTLLSIKWWKQNVERPDGQYRYFIPQGLSVKAGPIETAALKNKNSYQLGFSSYNLGTLQGTFYSEAKAFSFRDNKYVLTFIYPGASTNSYLPRIQG